MESNQHNVEPQHVPGQLSCPTWIKPEHIYPRAFIQRPAPYFEADSVKDGTFSQVKLTDFKGKYVVLFFYPLDFTFVCPTEIISYADAHQQFADNNCELIGAQIDSKFSHFEYTSKSRKKGGLGDLKIHMIADVTKAISQIYGALITQGGDAGVALRATFIIDDKGILRHAQYSDLPVGRNVDETLRLVQAFQYSDKHGEVCPAKWKPGSKSIKPGVKEIAEYISTELAGEK